MPGGGGKGTISGGKGEGSRVQVENPLNEGSASKNKNGEGGKKAKKKQPTDDE